MSFINNPYALIKNNLVTDIVFMAERNEDEIKELLSTYDFDEFISFEDYGHQLYLGFHKVGDFIAPCKPFPSWVMNTETNQWEPPNGGFYPKDENPNVLHHWWEDKQKWVPCELCQKNGLA